MGLRKTFTCDRCGKEVIDTYSLPIDWLIFFLSGPKYICNMCSESLKKWVDRERAEIECSQCRLYVDISRLHPCLKCGRLLCLMCIHKNKDNYCDQCVTISELEKELAIKQSPYTDRIKDLEKKLCNEIEGSKRLREELCVYLSRKS